MSTQTQNFTEAAVAECTALLKRFGITRVVGDRYAGEWPRSRFAEQGITFEQSAKPKSDIYHDLLPLLNAQRVELLDHPRMAAQICGLERRTARSGRDSIDHGPGHAHDDLANVCAGVLVNLDLDRRPSLVKQSDLGGDEGVPFPQIVDTLFAIVAASKEGETAVVYAALCHGYGTPLTILDFEPGFLSAGMFKDATKRLRELADLTKIRWAVTGLFASKELSEQARRAGVT